MARRQHRRAHAARAQHGRAVQLAAHASSRSQADVHDDAQLARLVAGCDAVINLVAILHGSAAEFERVHVDAAAPPGARPAPAPACAGWCTSARSASGPDAPSNYLRSKTAGEAVLSDGRARSHAAAALGDLRRRGPLPQPVRAACRRWPRCCRWPARGARFQPVWVDDVAAGHRQRCLDRRRQHRPDLRMRRADRLHAVASWCVWPAAGRATSGRQLPLPAALGRAAGAADGTGAGAAADVARQPRLDARAQRRHRHRCRGWRRWASRRPRSRPSLRATSARAVYARARLPAAGAHWPGASARIVISKEHHHATRSSATRTTRRGRCGPGC